jgi:hypothetical protein
MLDSRETCGPRAGTFQERGERAARARRTIGRGSGERLTCNDEDARAQVTSNFWTEESPVSAGFCTRRELRLFGGLFQLQ